MWIKKSFRFCFILNQDELSELYWIYWVFYLSHWDCLCCLGKHIYKMPDMKDFQISSQQNCTLAHLGLHSNCLHHSAAHWVSMSLTYTPTRAPALSSGPWAHFIKGSVGTNLMPSVWRLSYPAVTHNKIAGQRLAAAVRGVNVRLWQGSWENVRVWFSAFAELGLGRALFRRSTKQDWLWNKVQQVEANKGTWFYSLIYKQERIRTGY